MVYNCVYEVLMSNTFRAVPDQDLSIWQFVIYEMIKAATNI